MPSCFGLKTMRHVLMGRICLHVRQLAISDGIGFELPGKSCAAGLMQCVGQGDNK